MLLTFSASDTDVGITNNQKLPAEFGCLTVCRPLGDHSFISSSNVSFRYSTDSFCFQTSTDGVFLTLHLVFCYINRMHQFIKVVTISNVKLLFLGAFASGIAEADVSTYQSTSGVQK